MRSQTVILLPIAHDPADWARIAAPFPLSQEEWGMMMAILEASRPGLVQPDKPPADMFEGGLPLPVLAEEARDD